MRVVEQNAPSQNSTTGTGRTDRSGFTVVEILVSVLIIAIVVTVAIASMANARKDTERKACEANMSAIFQAEEAYRVRNRAYTATLSDLSSVVGGLPVCPVGPNAYTAAVSGSGAAQTVTITCPNSGAHVTGVTRSTTNGVTFTP
jgi:type IV pilus assembly protein PilE